MTTHDQLIIHINADKHVVIPAPEPTSELNLSDHLKSKTTEGDVLLNDELPPITEIKWGIGFVGNSDISWADEAEREQEYRRKKTAGMSWARITAA